MKYGTKALLLSLALLLPSLPAWASDGGQKELIIHHYRDGTPVAGAGFSLCPGGTLHGDGTVSWDSAYGSLSLPDTAEEVLEEPELLTAMASLAPGPLATAYTSPSGEARFLAQPGVYLVTGDTSVPLLAAIQGTGQTFLLEAKYQAMPGETPSGPDSPGKDTESPSPGGDAADTDRSGDTCVQAEGDGTRQDSRDTSPDAPAGQSAPDKLPQTGTDHLRVLALSISSVLCGAAGLFLFRKGKRCGR